MDGKNALSTERKRRSKPSECRICGASAFYSYFGVISCQACKVFFRRHALLEHNDLKCVFNGSCDVNIHTRHICLSCRLAKCFAEGMRSEMIRNSTFKKKVNIIVESKQIEKFPTRNLLDKDLSSLDDAQWILLSNLVSNYQDTELFHLSELVKNEGDSLKMINPPSWQHLLEGFYKTAGSSLTSNMDISHLQSDDRSILLNTAANNVTCIGAIMIFFHSQLINCELFVKYLEDMYGTTGVNYHRWSAKFIDSDRIFCKLAIALFALSSTTRTSCRNIKGEYENVHQILNIQDKYTELIWKYLLYKYGYEESIKRYFRMIECFLALTVYMEYIHSFDVHVNNVESLVEETELALILNDAEEMMEKNG